jgi:hypothetical protein
MDERVKGQNGGGAVRPTHAAKIRYLPVIIAWLV